MNSKTCCFTGSRPQKFSFGFDEKHPDCLRIKEMLFEKIEQAIADGFVHFVSGGALGVDTWAAEAVLKLKKRHSYVTLEVGVPCLEQEKSWQRKDKQRYRDVLKRADEVTVLQKNYTAGCMRRRNEYMVNKSSLVIAVWSGQKGGTASTIAYAKRHERTVVMIEAR